MPMSFVMRTVLFTVAAILVVLSSGQSALAASAARPLSVSPMTASRPDLGDTGQFRFPRVSGGRAAVAINTWLQVNELERFPGAQGKTPFDAVWPKQGEWLGVVSLDYQVMANTPGYLSLSVSGEYDGAYPNPYGNDYTFDVRSGKPLALADLFSEKGLKAFRAGELKQRLNVVDQALKQAVPDDTLTEDDMAAQRDGYTVCRRMLAEADSEMESYTLSGDALTVTWQCQFSHAAQALNDLGLQKERYSFVSLAPWLNQYGRCLLLNQGRDCVVPAKVEGVYRGRINGRYPITLVLGGQWSDAVYAYDRVGKPIRMSRKVAVDKRHYTLVHQGDDEKSETFMLTLDHGRLTGSWQQAGGAVLRVGLSAEPKQL